MARDQSSLPVRRGRQSAAPFSEGEFLSPSSFSGASQWQIMRRMQEDMHRMFGPLFPAQHAESGHQAVQTWNPSLDISENGKEWRIEIELPGVKNDDIDVKVQNGQLSVRTEMKQEEEEAPTGQDTQRRYLRKERRYGFFEQAFPLPDSVDEDNIRCDFRNGVLNLYLPKTEIATQQARQIPVGEAPTFQQRPSTQKKAA